MDIRKWRKARGPQLGQGVPGALLRREQIGEGGDDAPGQGDVPRLDGHPGRCGEGLNDG